MEKTVEDQGLLAGVCLSVLMENNVVCFDAETHGSLAALATGSQSRELR